MFVLGLTGSIGMGKTTAAAAFRREGVPVHDADATVHALMAAGGKAVPEISRLFPDCVVKGAVDRQKLGGEVFGNPAALEKLESVLHPLVRAEEQRFLRKHILLGAKMAVLDIPLLYETGGEDRCDAVAVVSAPGFVQRQRVLGRSGMTEEKMQAILARQTPDAEKRARADFVIQTGQGRADALRTIKEIVTLIRGKKAPRDAGTGPQYA